MTLYTRSISGGEFDSSLRSKSFRRAFRPLEAFFAFWLRKNWGERTNFPAAKKAKSASNVRKALPKRLLRRLRKRWLSLIVVTTIAIKCLSFVSRCCHLSLDRDFSTSYCQSSLEMCLSVQWPGGQGDLVMFCTGRFRPKVQSYSFIDQTCLYRIGTLSMYLEQNFHLFTPQKETKNSSSLQVSSPSKVSGFYTFFEF